MVLSDKQKELLPLVSSFSKGFGLVGGTSIALQLGHRRSIDFDLVTFSELNADKIRVAIGTNYQVEATLVNETNEYTVAINGVKVTFMHYPFKVDFDVRFQDYISMPSLTSLAAMKAYALGKRAKWKDYVDLYFIFMKFPLGGVLGKAKEIFGREFNEKLFREELSYFKDVDYTESIDYMDGFEISDATVKERLTEISLQKV